MSKKGEIQLSINAIIIIILALVILILGITFIKAMFGKTSVKFEESVSREPEPITPTASNPITLSRETVIADSGNTEALKISVFNPTDENWDFRDAIEQNVNLCGINGDSICYINTGSSQGNICNNDMNALANDDDCRNLDNGYNADGRLDASECDDEGGIITELPAGICFLDNINCVQGADPDCAPTEGVSLSIECSRELKLNTQTTPRTIESGEFTIFTAVLEIEKGIAKQTYLCKISVIGENTEGVTKDLTVRVS